MGEWKIDTKKKYLILKKEISILIEEGICIAFSGGVDSSLILKIASDEARSNGKYVNAVTFDTKLHPVADILISKMVAEEMGAIHRIIKINELDNEDIIENPIDRCYKCKKNLFENLIVFAKQNNLKHIVDGTNADDLKEYRPGLKALSELNIISPLAKLGITKKEVREMAKILGVSVSSRPSTPCMATRLPYNTKIEFHILEKIEKGEEYIKSLGFNVVRLRLHNDIVRIEIQKKEFMNFIEKRDIIINYLKKLGFVYITLDLEGFRSGSMDVYLKE